MMFLHRNHLMLLAGIALLMVAGLAHAQVVLDFEDGSLDAWEVIDEAPENLGDQGPSVWEIRDSQLGLTGKALYQGSNIWGSPADSMLLGTFIIYKGEKFQNFTLDIDVSAADNDGMGLVWAFDSTAQHYRAMMINDGWPDVPLDGYKGPMLIMHKRIGDQEPWYELLGVNKDNYTPYPEDGQPMHWTLEVADGNFTFTRDDGVSVSGSDGDYVEGYVGIQLYAQQAEFDNITITPMVPGAVSPAGKLAATWGNIKVTR